MHSGVIRVDLEVSGGGGSVSVSDISSAKSNYRLTRRESLGSIEFDLRGVYCISKYFSYIFVVSGL